MATRERIAVVGAGAFGGWTALQLALRGADVVLLDAWGPGNSRSSSGGESRVIRAIYGERTGYIPIIARAFDLWREHQGETGERLLHPTGALWLFPGDDAYARQSLEAVAQHGFEVQQLKRDEAERRFPQFDLDDVRSVWFEPGAGYLDARVACASVVRRFVAAGGDYRQLAARLGDPRNGRLDELELSDGRRLGIDAAVFACGPWLPGIFPKTLGSLIRPTKQDVFFFGTPPGDPAFVEPSMPVWVEIGDRMIYGIPGSGHRGLKVADDTRGPDFDPTWDARTVSRRAFNVVRNRLARRIPAMREAPLLETRVCQYSDTPDRDLIVDRHPAADNVWIVGGGSGHGFKLGPAVGEIVAGHLLEKTPVSPTFALDRFR